VEPAFGVGAELLGGAEGPVLLIYKNDRVRHGSTLGTIQWTFGEHLI
jgi:hypothetical protein